MHILVSVQHDPKSVFGPETEGKQRRGFAAYPALSTASARLRFDFMLSVDIEALYLHWLHASA